MKYIDIGAIKALKLFIKNNAKGMSILTASLLMMSVANTFFLPYVLNALIENTGVSWYEYTIGSVLFCLAAAGFVWAVNLLCLNNKKNKKAVDVVRYFGGILLTVLVFAIVNAIYSFFMGNIAVTWYYILKDIVAAKLAVDITARVINIPLAALMLCILGNVLTENKPVFKFTRNTYFQLLIAAALHAAIEYIMTIPSMKSIWLLAVTCVVNTVMYALLFAASVVLCNRSDESEEENRSELAVIEEEETMEMAAYEDDRAIAMYESENGADDFLNEYGEFEDDIAPQHYDVQSETVGGIEHE